MRKFLVLSVVVVTAMAVSASAEEVGASFAIEGSLLTEFEMRQITGRLFILDIDPLTEAVEFDYSQTPSDPDKEHCDIIAQNQANDMGLDTRDQTGSFRDYNHIRVEEIYQGYPNNRSSEPKEGTSGYYFTASGNGKEHMGTYTRRNGSKSYTRNMNRSFTNTEKSVEVPVGYKPPRVTSQVFVSLAKLPFFKRFHR